MCISGVVLVQGVFIVSLVCFSLVFERCVGTLLNYANLVKKSPFWCITPWKPNSKFGCWGAKGEFLIHPSYVWKINSVTVSSSGRLPAQAMQPKPAFLSAQQLSASWASTSAQLSPKHWGLELSRAADEFLRWSVSVCLSYLIITYSESLWDQSIGRSDQCPGTGKMRAKLQPVGVPVLFAFFSQ